jgi:hypothetical protein
MILSRLPLIRSGQVYLNEDLNEYLIVTSNQLGQVSYEGVGFKGQAEDLLFIERFKPVDPADVDSDELTELLSFCAEGAQALTGFILE